MTVTISLNPDRERLLQQRAAAAGVGVEVLVQSILDKELAAPLTLTEAAEPFAKAIDAARLTDEQFDETLRQARDAARAERKLKRA